MNIFSHFRLRTKLGLLISLSVLTLVASITVAGSLVHQRLLEERIDKMHAVVDAAMGIAQALEKRVMAGQLTHEQALSLMRDDIHAMRFENGVGYVYVQDLDNIIVFHGASPALEGKSSPATDEHGRLVTDMIREVLAHAEAGVIYYTFPKPGQTERQPKVSYAARFSPWGLVFVAGAYLDDQDIVTRATILRLGWISGAILSVSLLVAWLVNRDISGSLGRLKGAMEQLASGDLATDIPGVSRRDEVGQMAAAALVFKDNMVKADGLGTQQQEERARAEAAKRAALIEMAETVETEAGEAVQEVSRRTGLMAENASGMSNSASLTDASARRAATAAAQAQSNMQTIASAAEELSASIREIGGQVNQSSAAVARAVETGRTTRETIEALNEQVGRIGAVADMINEIARRTNLLALNATIEAARAGEAGKGFAVVASEVKQLATQTARSTEEIARHIASVRTATGASVTAVGQIEQTIGEINAIARSIAAAVEQQGAATAEIAHNVAETAAAANEMTQRVTEVSAEAERTGEQAAAVLENTNGLDLAVQALKRSIVHVVRTSTAEVDRRQYRRRPCLIEATVICEGRSAAGSIHDISERGCLVSVKEPYHLGQSIAIEGRHPPLRLQGTVVARFEGALHIELVGEGLQGAEADRISLTTVAELVRLTKNDHLAFVKRVTDAVAGHETVHPDSLATHHHCRLGQWYDSVSDPGAMALSSFKSMAEPHRGVHEAGRRAIAAHAAGDMTTAQRCIAEMRQHSANVLHGLDQFGHDFPATISQGSDRREAPMVA